MKVRRGETVLKLYESRREHITHEIFRRARERNERSLIVDRGSAMTIDGRLPRLGENREWLSHSFLSTFIECVHPSVYLSIP